MISLKLTRLLAALSALWINEHFPMCRYDYCFLSHHYLSSSFEYEQPQCIYSCSFSSSVCVVQYKRISVGY
jgi:hypothetical protein